MVDEYNGLKMRELRSRGVAVHKVCASHVRMMPDSSTRPLLQHEKRFLPKNPDDAGGLHEVVYLAIGARVMLRRNIMTSDGLVNGALGVITRMEWPDGRHAPLHDGEMPLCVYVKFDDPRVGRVMAAHSSHGDVPIEAVQSVFQGKRAGLVIARQQYPLLPAWALTVHKVQGLSMDRAVVHLGDGLFSPGQAYVALSRVRTMAGLAIEGFCAEKVAWVDPLVLEEYARLGVIITAASNMGAGVGDMATSQATTVTTRVVASLTDDEHGVVQGNHGGDEGHDEWSGMMISCGSKPSDGYVTPFASVGLQNIPHPLIDDDDDGSLLGFSPSEREHGLDGRDSYTPLCIDREGIARIARASGGRATHATHMACDRDNRLSSARMEHAHASTAAIGTCHNGDNPFANVFDDSPTSLLPRALFGDY